MVTTRATHNIMMKQHCEKKRFQQDKVGPGATHFFLYPILAETNFLTLIKTGNVSNHKTVACSLLWEKQ